MRQVILSHYIFELYWFIWHSRLEVFSAAAAAATTTRSPDLNTVVSLTASPSPAAVAAVVAVAAVDGDGGMRFRSNVIINAITDVADISAQKQRRAKGFKCFLI